MKFCENCGAKNANDATFCSECGTRWHVNNNQKPAIEPTTNNYETPTAVANSVVCANCQTANAVSNQFCENCGKPLAQVQQGKPVAATTNESLPPQTPQAPPVEQTPAQQPPFQQAEPIMQTPTMIPSHEQGIPEHGSARRAMYIAGAVVAIGGIGGAYYVSQNSAAAPQTEKVAKKNSSETDSASDAGSVENLAETEDASSADEAQNSSQAEADQKAEKTRAKKLAKVQADPDNKAPWFGMVTGDMPYDGGIMIYEIFPGYTASQSDLAPEMIITKMDGEEIPDTAAMKQFLTQHIIGDTIACTLQDGTEISVKLTTPRSKINNVSYDPTITPGSYHYTSDFSGTPLGEMNDDKEMGFYVTDNAYSTGPVSGDIVFKVGSYYVSTNEDIENAFSHSGPGTTVTVQYFDSDNQVQSMDIDLH